MTLNLGFFLIFLLKFLKVEQMNPPFEVVYDTKRCAEFFTLTTSAPSTICHGNKFMVIFGSCASAQFRENNSFHIDWLHETFDSYFFHTKCFKASFPTRFNYFYEKREWYAYKKMIEK